MSSYINKWRIYCITESKFVHGFLDGTQACTKCFNNDTHEINPNSITIEDTTSQNITLVSTNDNSSIDGNYVNQCYTISVAGGVDTVTTDIKRYGYAIGILSVYMDIHSDNINDEFSLLARPRSDINNGFIGVLPGNVSIDDTEIDVGILPVDFKIGYFLVLTNGVTTDDIEIINVSDNILTLKSGLANSYTGGSTYISFNLKRMRNYKFRSTGYRTIGNFLRISTFSTPMEAVIQYTNKSTTPKEFVCGLEYLC